MALRPTTDVVQQVSGSSDATPTYEYDTFGNQKETNENDPNPFRYCGEYFDKETEEVYLRNRYYDPSTGRFGQEDLARSKLNWYSYCQNNPLKYVDIWGLEEQELSHETGYFQKNRTTNAKGQDVVEIEIHTGSNVYSVQFAIDPSGIIRYDMNVKQNLSIFEQSDSELALIILANAMFEYSIEHHPGALNGRTIQGVANEIYQHYLNRGLGKGVQEADIGPSIKEGSWGYDSNAKWFEPGGWLGPNGNFDLEKYLNTYIGAITATSKPAGTPKKPSSYFVYIVKSGDSFWSIAELFLDSGFRWREIQAAAGKTWIDPGDRLVIENYK